MKVREIRRHNQVSGIPDDVKSTQLRQQFDLADLGIGVDEDVGPETLDERTQIGEVPLLYA